MRPVCPAVTAMSLIVASRNLLGRRLQAQAGRRQVHRSGSAAQGGSDASAITGGVASARVSRSTRAKPCRQYGLSSSRNPSSLSIMPRRGAEESRGQHHLAVGPARDKGTGQAETVAAPSG